MSPYIDNLNRISCKFIKIKMTLFEKFILMFMRSKTDRDIKDKSEYVEISTYTTYKTFKGKKFILDKMDIMSIHFPDMQIIMNNK